MKSPLLKMSLPQPERRYVAVGTHVTSASSIQFTVQGAVQTEVLISFGLVNPNAQWARAADLRELSSLLAEMADVLEGK